MTPEELFNKNEDLAKKYVNSNDIHISGNTKEDNYQIASMALWKACLSYDESRGTKFITYAWACISHEFFHLIKKDSRSIKTISIESLPPDMV